MTLTASAREVNNYDEFSCFSEGKKSYNKGWSRKDRIEKRKKKGKGECKWETEGMAALNGIGKDPDSAKSSRILAGTALSQAERCLGQR